MTHRMQELAAEIVRLQSELDREIEARRQVLGVRIKARLVEFEHWITMDHRRLRRGLAGFLARSSMATVLTAPVIYSLIVPMVLIDLWASLYQQICFRAYGIPRVARSGFILFDRRHLAYLNGIERLNCLYCAYCNGVIGYVREIGSRTEQYWCPIKHALRLQDPHRRYYEFLEYGDAGGYRDRLSDFRRRLSEPEPAALPTPD